MDNGMVYPRMISREILEAFETEKFDCIHVHHPMYVGPMALYLGKRYNLPVIYTYHTKYEDYLHYIRLFENVEERSAARQNVYRFGKEKLVPGYMKWFTNQCDLILAPTASMQEAMRKGGTKTPTAVFPTGLEDSFYIKDEEKSAELREKYLQGRKHLFCSVSRLEAEKNPKFLLRGIARLKERMDESFRLLLIGEGSMRAELEKMTAELGISEEVVFVGNVENTELKHYLNACELFLFASKSETQGIVLAEAMAAGTPVVAVHAVGSDDIVKDGVNGFLTEEEESRWAEKVIEAAQPENRFKMKKAALKEAQNYRSDTLALYEEMLYNQCICGKAMDRQKDGKGEYSYENGEAHGEGAAMAVHKISHIA